MSERTGDEASAVRVFLEVHFGVGYEPSKLTTHDRSIVKQVLGFVSDAFPRMRYVLGLALDFALLAQQLSNHDQDAKPARPHLTIAGLFERYELLTERAGRKANTLTMRYDGQTIGIRRLEEAVADLFIGGLARSGYPSSYVYNTGQWQKFQETLLLPCFQLSESGRFALCNSLIDFGLQNLTENRYFGRETPRVRLFDAVLHEYPRSSHDENAGTSFQAIAYGYFKADRPHLSLVVDKTRTGSSRQRRFGDIDGYFGLDLEVSVEVKDCAITAKNTASELGEFMFKVAKSRVQGIVACEQADEEAVHLMSDAGVRVLTLAAMCGEVLNWDWRKQDAALHGMLHYLAHVEQNPDAVHRLLCFVYERDPHHDAIAFYRESDSDAAK